MSEKRCIRAMIVDDETLGRERIRQLLRNDPEIEVVAECSNANEALSEFSRCQPELLFLDIQMPQTDGFAFLKKLDPRRMPLVIFVTAYDQYAMKAFEFHACDYLLKPFKRKRFEESVSWAKTEIKNKGQSEWTRRTLTLLESFHSRQDYLERITIKENDRLFFVRACDVDWFEAEDNYVRIHIAGTSHLVRQTIRSFEKELNPRSFVRVHRSAIVNVEHIRELQQWFRRDYRVVLQNGTVLPLGRTYRQNLRTVLGSEF